MKYPTLMVSFTVFLIGCSSPTRPNASRSVLPEPSYDTLIATTSLEGFRIQMTPRMAKLVAEQRGYHFVSDYSTTTFEDLIEAKAMREDASGLIFLSRNPSGPSDLKHEIFITFSNGRIEKIDLSHTFYTQQERDVARMLFERYKQEFKFLIPLTKRDDFESYTYSPNRYANMALLINERSPKEVKLWIYDPNYRLSRPVK